MADRSLLETGRVRRELDTLRDDLTRLRRDLGDALGAVVETRRRSGGGMNDQIKSGISHRLQQINDTYARARDTGQRSMRLAERRVSEHPFLSLAAALAIGSIFASIVEGLRLRRRR